jgi:hypothetical protein
MRPATAGTGATPLAGVLQVEERLRRVQTQQLPKLEQLRADLQRELSCADADALLEALQEHVDATAGLRLDLLVPQGLRAATPRRDEAAFRAQVVALAHCTEGTWSAVKSFMAVSIAQPPKVDPLLSDFIMEVRGVQKRGEDCATVLQQWLPDASAGASESTQELARRALACGHRVETLLALCDAARDVRRLVHDLEQERASLHAALTALARGLGGGLLDGLRRLVANRFGTASAEMAAAQQAQSEQQALLRAATGRLVSFLAIRRDAGDVLAAIGRIVRAVS